MQLASCESSDWFWWFGDYNPAHSVASFDRLFRHNLTELYRLLKLPPPEICRSPSAKAVVTWKRAGRCGVLRESPPAAEEQVCVLREPVAYCFIQLPFPGHWGSGDFGADAYRFVDWLVSAGQTYWQMLPLGEIGPGNSPYMSSSVFAGNILLIDLVELAEPRLADRRRPEAASGIPV